MQIRVCNRNDYTMYEKDTLYLHYDNWDDYRIQGDYLVVFRFMDELRAIAHTYPKKKAGAVKFANGTLAFE